jgi:hypothetical protein
VYILIYKIQGYIFRKIRPPSPDVRCHLGEKDEKEEERKGENLKEKGRKMKEKGKLEVKSEN